jgi:hypothetical protein
VEKERPTFDKDQPSEQPGPPNTERYTHKNRSKEDREPGTRPDAEAMPPASIDPKPEGKDAKPNRDATAF